MKSRIMYSESKAGGLVGSARIGRVTFAKTGATLYYAGKSFQSFRGSDFKSNYFEVGPGNRTGSLVLEGVAKTACTPPTSHWKWTKMSETNTGREPTVSHTLVQNRFREHGLGRSGEPKTLGKRPFWPFRGLGQHLGERRARS